MQDKNIIKLNKITDLLLNSENDHQTLYSAIYDMYFFIGVAKGVDDINNNRGISQKEFEDERKKLYAKYSG